MRHFSFVVDVSSKRPVVTSSRLCNGRDCHRGLGRLRRAYLRQSSNCTHHADQSPSRFKWHRVTAEGQLRKVAWTSFPKVWSGHLPSVTPLPRDETRVVLCPPLGLKPVLALPFSFRCRASSEVSWFAACVTDPNISFDTVLVLAFCLLPCHTSRRRERAPRPNESSFLCKFASPHGTRTTPVREWRRVHIHLSFPILGWASSFLSNMGLRSRCLSSFGSANQP